MTEKYRETKKNWDKNHSRIIKASKAKYDQNHPTWSFRLTSELKEWLESERWDDEKTGKPETNAALVKRKLEKLMKLEQQGY
jgi:O-methyltransferase involved in polyketide biosynthesis